MLSVEEDAGVAGCEPPMTLMATDAATPAASGNLILYPPSLKTPLMSAEGQTEPVLWLL